eukprot:symbB.v1.2.026843.t1/scaffold2588.1/size75582/6
MRCSRSLQGLLALVMYVALTRPSCFIAGAPASTGLRGHSVARAAVQLDIPMKEADLTQPKEAGFIWFWIIGILQLEQWRNQIERATSGVSCPLLSSSMAESP